MMKISEELIAALDLEVPSQKEPINAMKCGEVFSMMEKSALRMVSKSRIYMQEQNADVQMDCIDIVTAKLNEFSQMFRDVVIFMREQEGTYNGAASLRYCMTSYDTFGFPQTDCEEMFLNELLLRNEITHDYFNIEIHRQKLIGIMEGCIEGALDVCEHLKAYCVEHELMEKAVHAKR